jgi:membrane dipeptidase
MNRLGILIDITHGTEAIQTQLIEASRTLVVASHESIRAVSGMGMFDNMLKALASKGGVVGIHGAAGIIGKRYRKWLAENRERAEEASKATPNMVGYRPKEPRAAGDRGEYIERFDREFAEVWRSRASWREIPDLGPFIPNAEEWAEHVDHVIKAIGVDHVAIGLDLAGARSAIPVNSGGYGELAAALKRISTPANIRKIAGENWFRVIDAAKV